MSYLHIPWGKVNYFKVSDLLLQNSFHCLTYYFLVYSERHKKLKIKLFKHIKFKESLFSKYIFKINLFYLIFCITQWILLHLWLYNDHHNQILQHFHPKSSVHPPTYQPVSFGNHTFFKVCESVSVLKRSSMCSFFRFHM